MLAACDTFRALSTDFTSHAVAKANTHWNALPEAAIDDDVIQASYYPFAIVMTRGDEGLRAEAVATGAWQYTGTVLIAIETAVAEADCDGNVPTADAQTEFTDQAHLIVDELLALVAKADPMYATALFSSVEVHDGPWVTSRKEAVKQGVLQGVVLAVEFTGGEI